MKRFTEFANRLAIAFAEDKVAYDSGTKLAVDIVSNHTESELIKIGSNANYGAAFAAANNPFVTKLGHAIAKHLKNSKFPVPPL